MSTQSVPSSDDLAEKLCEALRLDPGQVMRIEIDVQAGDPNPIVIKVTMAGDEALVFADWKHIIPAAHVEVYIPVRSPLIDMVPDEQPTVKPSEYKEYPPGIEDGL